MGRLLWPGGRRESLVKGESWKTASQMLAILAMAAILSMVAHKAHHDITLIAAKHSGVEFWKAVGKYVIGNIAGGNAS